MRNLVIQKENVVLNVGAASSRNSCIRGWSRSHKKHIYPIKTKNRTLPTDRKILFLTTHHTS
jgi:hypothetical protein